MELNLIIFVVYNYFYFLILLIFTHNTVFTGKLPERDHV